MARVTNEQLLTEIKGLSTRVSGVEERVGSIENILMSNPGRNNKGLNPTIVFLVRWVVFPLIVIIGSVVGVTVAIPGG